MRELKRIKPYLPWLLTILAVDGFCIFLLWMADIEALTALIGLIVLATLVFFIAICLLLMRKEKQKEKVLLRYLDDPSSAENFDSLYDLYGAEKEETLKQLFNSFQQKNDLIQQSMREQQDYEDYVETWAHEIKLPLSLLTMILDNDDGTIPPELFFKLDYIRNETQRYVSQILFYHRIKSKKKDYLFQDISLLGCVEEVLADYGPSLREKGFQLSYDPVALDVRVFTDPRALEFILRQLVSNSIKYAGALPVLSFLATREAKGRENGVLLRISDNGQGVKECDLPYLFERGFSGDSGELRKKSTGMGLYLAKQLADDIHIQLEVDSKWEEGFTASLFIND